MGQPGGGPQAFDFAAEFPVPRERPPPSEEDAIVTAFSEFEQTVEMLQVRAPGSLGCLLARLCFCGLKLNDLNDEGIISNPWYQAIKSRAAPRETRPLLSSTQQPTRPAAPWRGSAPRCTFQAQLNVVHRIQQQEGLGAQFAESCEGLRCVPPQPPFESFPPWKEL